MPMSTNRTAPHKDTIAIVTGGAQGIGRAIAERLVADGCSRMVIAGRTVEAGEAASAELSAQGADVRFVATDMGDARAASSLVDRTITEFGTATARANAAGLSERGGILDASPDCWDRVMAVNAKGPFFALQRLAQHAVETGRPATCVSILSMSSHVGQSFLGPYAASKAAMANVTRNAAQALRGNRVRVNAINCGWMDTPGEDLVQKRWHGADDDWLTRAEAAQPFGMLVKPAHVAELASYLLGPNSGVMTGSVIDFDQFVAGAYPE